MNDTIQIANDTLCVAISAFNGAKQNINNIDMWKNICVLIVVAVIVIAITQLIAKICSQFHEKDMLKLNSEKEERKQLLDFCYEMAKKKESATKDYIKETTITETTKTTTKGTSAEKGEEQTTNSSTKVKSAENEETETTESSNKGTSTENEETSSSVVNTTTKENKEVEHKEGTITLDQIRQECWLIIKKMNDINDLK